MSGKNYNSKRNLLSLLSIIFIDQTYITISFPLLTLIFYDSQSHLFTSDTSYSVRSMWYGFCVALPQFINMFFAPLLSGLSDEFGRKKILIIEIFSAAIFTASVGLGIYSGKIALVFIGFLIRGAFSRTNPTALTMIGDMTSREKKILYMGYLQFAISLGAFLGPILGGYFAHSFFFTTFNFSLPFFLAMLLAISNVFFAFYSLRETLQKDTALQKESQISFQAIKNVLTHKETLRISLLLLLIQISWSTYYQFIPPILKTIYRIDAHALGWFMGMIAFWLAIATSLGLKLLHRYFNLHQILLISIYLILFGLILTVAACSKLLPFHYYFAWVSAIPIAAGDVIAYSCLTALYSNVASHEKQGKTMGVSFIVVGCAWSATGLIGGALMSISPLLPLILAPIGTICALFLLYAPFGKKLVLSYVS